jgi:hypothetical protein
MKSLMNFITSTSLFLKVRGGAMGITNLFQMCQQVAPDAVKRVSHAKKERGVTGGAGEVWWRCS